MQQIARLVRSSERYSEIFRRARESRTRTTTVFDASARCNLFCEGCLFFNRDGGYDGALKGADVVSYHQLFSAEKARGVNYPIFGGAEPSLNQHVLRIAAEYFSSGMIHTNGIKPIDLDLPFRLYVSLWGGAELSKKWRGADCYDKVLEAAARDRRAIINYTVNSQNIDDIASVVRDCASLGQTITFQVYSPTEDYSGYLSAGIASEHEYIQSNDVDDNLVMTAADDEYACDVICSAIAEHPETVVFTKALALWVFGRRGSHPDAPSDGSAPKDCLAANDPEHRHNLFGGGVESTKACGHPSVNCNTCRTYTTIYPQFLKETLAQSSTEQGAKDFLDGHEVFDMIYEGHRRSPWQGAADNRNGKGKLHELEPAE